MYPSHAHVDHCPPKGDPKRGIGKRFPFKSLKH